MVLKVQTLRL